MKLSINKKIEFIIGWFVKDNKSIFITAMPKEIKMKEIEKTGNFKLYDRVKIKETEITGNIVLIHNEKTCEVEYDDKYKNQDNLTETHSIEELERE